MKIVNGSATAGIYVLSLLDAHQADDLQIEFDEDLHFNRYKNLTLATPWALSFHGPGVHCRFAVAM